MSLTPKSFRLNIVNKFVAQIMHLMFLTLKSFKYNCLALLKMCSISHLTHRGRVTHICVSELTIIGSDNGLSPGRRQAIIWTNAGILLIGPLGTNFNEILIGIQTFSFKKMHLKMSSAKRRPFCLGLNMLMRLILISLQFICSKLVVQNVLDVELMCPSFSVEKSVTIKPSCKNVTEFP